MMDLILVAVLLGVGSDGYVPKRTYVDPDHLPAPYQTPSKKLSPVAIRGHGDPKIKLPPGFSAKVFARLAMSPRNLAVAPNGDVFVVESYQGKVRVLWDFDRDGVSDGSQVFTDGLKLPFGIAFHGDDLYVANTDSVVRFPYRSGLRRSDAPGEKIVKGIPSRGYRQHWTRNIAFSPDGSRMYLTVGSETDKSPEPTPRGTVLVYDTKDWKRRVFASGLRNPVGLAIRPGTEEVWATCVERDFYGDDLVPDFFARLTDGAFFGWPYYYIGRHPDPFNRKRKAPNTNVKIPETLFTAHSVPLGMCFYTGSQFPEEYRGDAFVAMRGSNNRSRMSGYMIARIDFRDGKPVPGYEHFATGWSQSETSPNVYGRPTGVAVGSDGSLFVADEVGRVIWRITYRG
jgi:glucose/arabinose dehydrogenase